MKNKYKILWFAAILLTAAITPNPANAAEGKIAGCSAQLKGESFIPKSTKISDRINILREYLASHNSPLANSAETFIYTAEKNNLDWRLLPAISGIESTFGKRTAQKTNNPFGWGGGQISFISWDAAIEHVGEKLRVNYMNKWGAKTVEEIAPIYAPPSNTWARNVRLFMNDISNFEEKSSNLALNLSL